MRPGQEQIRQRAYELLRDLEDWLLADKELTEPAVEPELRPAEPIVEERCIPKTKTAAADGVSPA